MVSTEVIERWRKRLANKVSVYCVDRLPEPAPEYYETEKRVGQFGGSIHYRQVDVQDAAGLDASVAEIAQQHQRLDGLIAAAGVQHVSSALEYPSEKIGEVRRAFTRAKGSTGRADTRR